MSEVTLYGKCDSDVLRDALDYPLSGEYRDTSLRRNRPPP